MQCSDFPGAPLTVSSSAARSWSVEKQHGMQLLIDGVLVGEPVILRYNNLVIDILTALEMPNGLVFCFERNKMTRGVYFGAFKGDSHCTYARITDGPLGGLGLLSAILQLAPDALPEATRVALGDGDLNTLMELKRTNRLQL